MFCFLFGIGISLKIHDVARGELVVGLHAIMDVHCTRYILDKAKKKADRTITSKINWKKTDLNGYRRSLVELLAEFAVTAASVDWTTVQSN